MLLLAIAFEPRGSVGRTQLIDASIRLAAEGGVKEAQSMLSARKAKGKRP